MNRVIFKVVIKRHARKIKKGIRTNNGVKDDGFMKRKAQNFKGKVRQGLGF